MKFKVGDKFVIKEPRLNNKKIWLITDSINGRYEYRQYPDGYKEWVDAGTVDDFYDLVLDPNDLLKEIL